MLTKSKPSLSAESEPNLSSMFRKSTTTGTPSFIQICLFRTQGSDYLQHSQGLSGELWHQTANFLPRWSQPRPLRHHKRREEEGGDQGYQGIVRYARRCLLPEIYRWRREGEGNGEENYQNSLFSQQPKGISPNKWLRSQSSLGKRCLWDSAACGEERHQITVCHEVY